MMIIDPFRSAELWTPAEIVSGLEAWYDASDASTITESAGQVSQWDDKSANGRDLTTVGSNTPEWGLGAQINGMNVMHYASTLDQMDIDIASVDMTEYCLLGVGEPKAAGDWPAMGYVAKTDLTDSIDARLQNDAIDGRINHAIKFDNVAYNLTSAEDVAIRDDVPFVLATWYDGADGVARVNGGAVSVTNTNFPDSATFTMNKIRVGRTSNTPRNYQGECIILSTSNIALIRRIEGYLAWKWGLQASLATGHQYKSNPPRII